MRICENIVLGPKYINIYEFRGDTRGMYMVYRTFFCLLFKEIEKVQEHDLYLNQIQHHFDLKHFFLEWNKKLRKGGPTPISLRSEYSSSN